MKYFVMGELEYYDKWEEGVAINKINLSLLKMAIDAVHILKHHMVCTEK